MENTINITLHRFTQTLKPYCCMKNETKATISRGNHNPFGTGKINRTAKMNQTFKIFQNV